MYTLWFDTKKNFNSMVNENTFNLFMKSRKAVYDGHLPLVERTYEPTPVNVEGSRRGSLRRRVTEGKVNDRQGRKDSKLSL